MSRYARRTDPLTSHEAADALDIHWRKELYPEVLAWLGREAASERMIADWLFFNFVIDWEEARRVARSMKEGGWLRVRYHNGKPVTVRNPTGRRAQALERGKRIIRVAR